MRNLLDRIKKLEMPNVAIIDGYTISVGVMLALAHKYIFMKNDPKLIFSLRFDGSNDF